MTTLKPREPYTQDELEQLYPANLELRLVQVLLRHGERAPVSVRFQNVLLPTMICLYNRTDTTNRPDLPHTGHTATLRNACVQ